MNERPERTVERLNDELRIAKHKIAMLENEITQIEMYQLGGVNV